MSQMFYAVLAGERGKKAAAHARRADENYEAAKSWEDTAKQWQVNAMQWKEEATALRSSLVKWQKAAMSTEAEARAAVEISRELHNGAGPKTIVGSERFDALVKEKQDEVIKEWGLNPWEND